MNKIECINKSINKVDIKELPSVIINTGNFVGLLQIDLSLDRTRYYFSGYAIRFGTSDDDNYPIDICFDESIVSCYVNNEFDKSILGFELNLELSKDNFKSQWLKETILDNLRRFLFRYNIEILKTIFCNKVEEWKWKPIPLKLDLNKLNEII